jgi:hypothetical protein
MMVKPSVTATFTVAKNADGLDVTEWVNALMQSREKAFGAKNVGRLEQLVNCSKS